MIYTALSSIAFTLAMVLSGVGMFGASRWWVGVAAGALAAIAWHFNRGVGVLLGIVGMGLLLLASFGLASDIAQSDRAMFNGMALGCLLGLGVCAALRWNQVKPHLVQLARLERVRWLSVLLGDSRKP